MLSTFLSKSLNLFCIYFMFIFEFILSLHLFNVYLRLQCIYFYVFCSFFRLCCLLLNYIWWLLFTYPCASMTATRIRNMERNIYPACASKYQAEVRPKIVGTSLAAQPGWNWSSFQPASSTPPLNVVGSARAPSESTPQDRPSRLAHQLALLRTAINSSCWHLTACCEELKAAVWGRV